ncbi:7SK snRNA methylphosphate capping enzyme-like [Brevipalpus obovatus]|uniref:7SK snRNA methylphosphate capping enzyme-like n=1 Tax=Brevipalpus obovatus TaxID=246614 RepID=UPI003D9DEC1A
MANAEIVTNRESVHKPKRRYTPHYSGRYINNKRKRRSDIPKFLLGGNINDPLNLASFSGECDQTTPHSSPLPTPKHKKEVEVLIPANLKDPLNLNSNDSESGTPIALKASKWVRKRKRKRTDSDSTIDDETQKVSKTSDSTVNCQEKNYDSVSLPPCKCPRTYSTTKKIDSGGDETLRASSPHSNFDNKASSSENFREKISERRQTHRAGNLRFGRGQHHTQHRFQSRDARFQFGNYNRYYGYRNQNMAPDPRLKCFKSEWFEDQDILDIGCNVGHVTLAIARDFNPNMITGIDLDENLIKAANRNIRHYVTSIQRFSRKKIDLGDRTESVMKPSGKQTTEIQNEPSENPIINETLTRPSIHVLNKFDHEKEESPPDQTPEYVHRTTHSSPIHKKSSPLRESNSLGDELAVQKNFSESEKLSDQSCELLIQTHSIAPKDLTDPIKMKDHSSDEIEKCKSCVTKDVAMSTNASNRGRADIPHLRFPKNVQFIVKNYVLSSDDQLKEEKPIYDCILCLSVTKWIHLNFGDRGLKRAFKRMYAQLKPGGKLILEAQPWVSYKKKKYLTESLYNNYWAIKFKPEHFNEFLLSREVGFNTLELIDTPMHETKGFRRPIFLFRKSVGK